LMRDMKDGKAAGVVGMPVELLKYLQQVDLRELTALGNREWLEETAAVFNARQPDKSVSLTYIGKLVTKVEETESMASKKKVGPRVLGEVTPIKVLGHLAATSASSVIFTEWRKIDFRDKCMKRDLQAKIKKRDRETDSRLKREKQQHKKRRAGNGLQLGPRQEKLEDENKLNAAVLHLTVNGQRTK
ncbi:hypothetical protein ILUMI_18349, partial [Ignelater luminosus]